MISSSQTQRPFRMMTASPPTGLIASTKRVMLCAIAGFGCLVLTSSTPPPAFIEYGMKLPVKDPRFGYLESFAHLEAMRNGGTELFASRIESRLPKYKGLMKSVAWENHMDWHLLAAMSYQESFWDPDATSPTGVRGMMMLTEDTAEELEVDDRTDPRESLEGGARYFTQLHDDLPDRIAEPDRTLMALAAYNMGMSHLEDARILTQRYGKDPDSWLAVKEFLPLLQQKPYYKTLEHGYARGDEALAYVSRIRQYHTILTWHTRLETYNLAAARASAGFSAASAPAAPAWQPSTL